jgi:hypothetical protein
MSIADRKEIFKLKVNQLDNDFLTRCIDTAKDFNLTASVHYEYTTIIDTLSANINHYRVVVEGNPDIIKEFKTYMGVKSNKTNIVIYSLIAALTISCYFNLYLWLNN